MAITVEHEGQQLQPVFNPLLITLDSTLKTESSFNFVADILARGITISRIKAPVSPDGYGIFDIQRHLENEIYYDFDPNASGFNPATGIGLTYSLQFSEEFRFYFDYDVAMIWDTDYVAFGGQISGSAPYLSVGDEVVVKQDSAAPTNLSYNGIWNITGLSYSNAYDGGSDFRWFVITDVPFGVTPSSEEGGLISLSNFRLTEVVTTQGITQSYGVGMVRSFTDFISWNVGDWKPAAGSDAKFLTDAPNNFEIDTDSLMFLNIFDPDDIVDSIKIDTTNGSFGITNSVTATNGFVQVAVGPSTLTSVTASTVVYSGALPVISGSSETMVIRCYDVAGVEVTASKTYSVVSKCSKFDKIHFCFVDKGGSIVPWLFNLKNRNNKGFERTNYNQKYGQYSDSTKSWTWNTWDHGSKVLDIVTSDRYVVTTDWLDQNHSNYFMQLLESPCVWAKIDGNWLAVNLLDAGVERKQTKNDLIINYTIEFELSVKNNNMR